MDREFSILNAYTDHMVLQREMPIRIAGTSAAFEPVVVSFDSDVQRVRADADGVWEVEFAARKAGGPHTISAKASAGATITLSDILVGEVWYASGQSNMEFPVCGAKFYSLPDGEKVAAEAHDPLTRILVVPKAVAPRGPQLNMSRGECPSAVKESGAVPRWRVADSREGVASCSAVAYLFARHLRKMLPGVPIGIVSCSWGGAMIEPWLSEDALRRHHFDKTLEHYLSHRDYAAGDASSAARKAAKARMDENRRNFLKWLAKFNATDPAATRAARREWAKPAFDDTSWSHGILSVLSGAAEPGVIWYRQDIEVPKGWDTIGATLRFSWANDTDETFWDGVEIGRTTVETQDYWAAPRMYAIPAMALTPGRHVLAVRVSNHFCVGGLADDARIVNADGKVIAFAHDGWRERVEFRPKASIGIRPPVLPPGSEDCFFMQLPTTMYNAMFAPVSRFRYRGMLWYQGCSNAGSKEYAKQERALIDCIRRATRNKEMAYLNVALAAYCKHTPERRLPDDFWKDLLPAESNFAIAREQQLVISARDPFAGTASAVDVGDHSDIHPADKETVARRLAALAGRICYGRKGIASGPRFAKAVREKGGAIRVSFTDIGGGLKVKGGHGFGPQAFAVASAKGPWVWADEARLDGDTVVVRCSTVPDARRIRYAWADYPPSVRLYNKEGFPAFPFQGVAK